MRVCNQRKSLYDQVAVSLTALYHEYVCNVPDVCSNVVSFRGLVEISL